MVRLEEILDLPEQNTDQNNGGRSVSLESISSFASEDSDGEGCVVELASFFRPHAVGLYEVNVNPGTAAADLQLRGQPSGDAEAELLASEAKAGIAEVRTLLERRRARVRRFLTSRGTGEDANVRPLARLRAQFSRGSGPCVTIYKAYRRYKRLCEGRFRVQDWRAITDEIRLLLSSLD